MRVIENVWVLYVCFLMWIFFLVWMGIIGIIRGMGKNFKIWRYPFYKLKSHRRKTVPDNPIIHLWQTSFLEKTNWIHPAIASKKKINEYVTKHTFKPSVIKTKWNEISLVRHAITVVTTIHPQRNLLNVLWCEWFVGSNKCFYY